DRAVDPFGAPSEKPAVLAAVNSYFETGIKSPLDTAILNAGPVNAAAYRKVDEVPFDFERRRLTVVVDGPAGRLLVTTGAPESVVACCTQVEVAGQVVPLDDAARARFTKTFETLCAEGFRLLAVACRTAAPQPAYRVADEAGLTLVGLLAFADP